MRNYFAVRFIFYVGECRGVRKIYKEGMIFADPLHTKIRMIAMSGKR